MKLLKMADFYAAASGSGCSSSAASAAAMACTSSRWLTEEVFKLIDMVQRDEAIYNPRHKYYFCRPYVENFWREVDLKLEKNPGASLAKWTNLRISFRREYTNYLEEKVPPCWSYFDRMFFLHPYLRKKHTQQKSIDSQVQDALVQISSLSNRLQRERAAAAVANAAAAANLSASSSARNSTHAPLPSTQQPLDNYLEYFDDPEQNNSELDEIIDEEQRSRFQNMEETHSLNNDIKSECDENVDDFDAVETRNEEDEQLEEADDNEMRNFVVNACTSTLTQEKRQNSRLQHLNRLQTRSYYEDLRAKRPHSHETINISHASSTSTHTQRLLCSSTPAHSSTNVSFVRPTVAAKPLELCAASTNDAELPNSSSSIVNTSSSSAIHSTTFTHAQQQRHSQHHPHQRLEISSISSTGLSAANTIGNLPAQAGHLELCDCKTDPDAMFLMSLLPDIQKLNGRDRGKIKIAFQNILQDYLYPD